MKPIDMLMAVAVATLWGMGFVVAKAGMEQFPPIFLMALRFALSALCLAWFFRAHWRLLRRMFAVALIGATLQYSLTFTGLSGLDVSTAALLIQLEVPFAILLAWIVLRDRIGLRQASGIALALFGIVQIVGAPSLSSSLTHVAMVIGGAFAWAVGQIMIKRLGAVGGFALITWMAVMATPQLLIASWLLERGQIEAIATASPAAWGSVVYLGLGMTVLAYAMWYRLLGLYPLSRVMPFLLLLPLTSVAGGIFFFDERLTLDIAIGGLCILTGVAVINLKLRAAA